MLNRAVVQGARSCLFAVGLAACAPDDPTGIPVPAIERVSGDAQTAPPDSPLERPLVARIRNRRGRPLANARVSWRTDAGTITPGSYTSDANGRITAIWKLGPSEGVQRATVVANGVDSTAFTAFVESNGLPDRMPLRVLNLDTYDASGQVVHPDVVIGPFGETDDAWRLVITPYPGGNASFENPSLYIRNGRTGWRVPEGVKNPLVFPTSGYLSDPDIVWLDDRHEFWVFYRGVDKENQILVIKSADGVHWGEPTVVVHAPNHEAISPSVVRRGPDDWLMWTVNSGTRGCTSFTTTVEVRHSSDGENWSPPTPVSLTQEGRFPWHIEVQWIPSLGEYWALFNAKVEGSCTTDALYLATSPDGLTWRTYESPMLRRGAIPEFEDIVYRSTFAYDARRDAVSIWYSGARATFYGYAWNAAFERIGRPDLFEEVNRPDVAIRIPSTARPLTNATAP